MSHISMTSTLAKTPCFGILRGETLPTSSQRRESQLQTFLRRRRLRKLRGEATLTTGTPILVCGNGPGVVNIPDQLLFLLPVFAMNLWPVHHRMAPEHWTAWDTWSLVEVLPILRPQTKIHLNKRIKAYHKNTFGEDSTYDINWWVEKTPVPGIPYNKDTGLVFTTTSHAAVYRSYTLGYNPIFLAGFDCTKGILHDNPHFYDPDKPAEYHPGWDSEMSSIAKFLDARGVEFLNISSPTAAHMSPRGSMEAVLERYS